MSDLPIGWASPVLREVIELKYGKTLTEKNRIPGQYKVYGSNGVIGFHQIALTQNSTILVGRKGSIGEIHFSSEPCWPIDTTYYIDDFFGQPKEFLVYLLKYLNLGSYNRATAIPGLTREEVYKISIPLPPLGEQGRIVEKLDELLGRSRRAREELQHIPKLIQRYKQAVLAAAFRGDLTADWRELASESDTWIGIESSIELGSVIDDIRYGTSKKCDYFPIHTPVLRIPNIGDGHVIKDDLKYAAFNSREIENLQLCSGDILVIRSNGSLDLVGKAAIASDKEEGFLYAGYLIRIRPDLKAILPKYLYFHLTEPQTRAEIEALAKSTSGVNNINSQELKSLRLFLPDLTEQKEIVRRVEERFKAIEAIEQNYQKAIQLLNRLDQATLAKAFRGQLVPQDPNDEPASVLLERIRAQRASQPPARKRKPKATQ